MFTRNNTDVFTGIVWDVQGIIASLVFWCNKVDDDVLSV